MTMVTFTFKNGSKMTMDASKPERCRGFSISPGNGSDTDGQRMSIPPSRRDKTFPRSVSSNAPRQLSADKLGAVVGGKIETQKEKR